MTTAIDTKYWAEVYNRFRSQGAAQIKHIMKKKGEMLERNHGWMKAKRAQELTEFDRVNDIASDIATEVQADDKDEQIEHELTLDWDDASELIEADGWVNLHGYSHNTHCYHHVDIVEHEVIDDYRVKIKVTIDIENAIHEMDW